MVFQQYYSMSNPEDDTFLADDNECPYCEQRFEDETEKGIHISQEHVDTDSSITKSKGQRETDTNIVKEKWSTDGDRGEAI